MIGRMKLVFMTPAVGLLAILFTSCGTSKGPSDPLASTGPFDKNGTYREDWADDPSKWRKSGGGPSPHETRSDEIPFIAKNDEPPSNSNPLPPARTRSSTPVLAQKKPAPPSVAPAIASNPRKSSSAEASPKPKPTERKATAKTTPKATAKTKPKPVLVKAKPKPKPAPKKTRYVVKKGDSLSAISSRTGASVSAIRKENGMSGTMIHPGQSLVIPKR
jgi:LysM repeat protein